MVSQAWLKPYRQAAIDADSAVLIVDGSFRIVWANTRLLDRLSYDLEDVQQVDVRSLRADLRDLGPQRLVVGTSTFRDSFGDQVTFRTQSVPLFEEGVHQATMLLLQPEGDAGREMNVLRESLHSTESLLRESQLLYRELYENSSDLIQSTDIEGRLMFVNDAWLSVLGYTERQVATMTMQDLLVGEQPEAVAWFRCESTPPEAPVRMELHSVSGAPVWVEGRVHYRHVESRIVGAHAILRDITERERLERMKAQFVSMVNHELRTPLTSIVGSLNLLRDGRAGTIDDRARKFVDIALRNSDRLDSLVQQVLDYEKLSVGRLELQPSAVSLNEFLRGLSEDQLGFASARGVQVSAESTALVATVDPKLLQHIVGNLLANAIRFAASRVVLGASQGDSVIRIWVHDDGPGVPVAFRPKLFDAFEQASNSKEGTGLGLNIAQTMSDRLGAKLGFVSLENHGSTFFVDLDAPDVCGEEVSFQVDGVGPDELVKVAGSNPLLRLHLQDIGDLSAGRILRELEMSRVSLEVDMPDGEKHDLRIG